eukprot:CAMPEP_0180809598 /NCGR_PEP_ID=MMETSP1038_2-20121128/64409_1 /TAXON_ID=632150 /ORGANISM="Azadinium spinosum, Strain 3D9" /LENGTH=91 /DNA_ID=CAMNT_0022850777 /DNA_START=157 /DNA_END=432 /DNA_ORIENTATION=-
MKDANDRIKYCHDNPNPSLSLTTQAPHEVTTSPPKLLPAWTSPVTVPKDKPARHPEDTAVAASPDHQFATSLPLPRGKTPGRPKPTNMKAR